VSPFDRERMIDEMTAAVLAPLRLFPDHGAQARLSLRA
jgi:hypothetical protein